MAHGLQVGDRVKNTTIGAANGLKKGTVISAQNCHPYRVRIRYDDGAEGSDYGECLDYKLIEREKSNMKNLGIMMKKLLDTETQTLVKAGFINGDLELTDNGVKGLLAILFSEKKKDLVKMAEEIIEEAKKE